LGGTANTGQGNSVNNSLTGNSTIASSLLGNDGNDTIVGGGSDDTFLGGAHNDSILGGGGNDSLDGGLGNDTMAGGAGDDIYIVDSTLDIVFEETGAGVDEIQSSVDFTLSANVENLVLDGGPTDHLNATGNALTNSITGNAGNNSLLGLGGRDYLLGDAGNDTLDGGDLEDFLFGGTGNDSLFGGDGGDILNGTNSTATAGEIDTLTGGSGGDLFVLGASSGNFYGLTASNNYAYITDFSVADGDRLLLQAGVNYHVTSLILLGGGVENNIYLNNSSGNLIAGIRADASLDLNAIGIFV
jgi:Ca2+-binding RTX toxin-like protein